MNSERSEQDSVRPVRRAAPEKARAPVGGLGDDPIDLGAPS